MCRSPFSAASPNAWPNKAVTSPQREDGYRRVKSSISCFGPPFTYEPYTQECYECSSGQSCGQPSSPVGGMRDHPLTIAT